jgi:hypothetical protein
MVDKNVLDFHEQAEQLIQMIQSHIAIGQRKVAIEILVLKFKALYEQGIASGQLYEREGTFPYSSFAEER